MHSRVPSGLPPSRVADGPLTDERPLPNALSNARCVADPEALVSSPPAAGRCDWSVITRSADAAGAEAREGGNWPTPRAISARQSGGGVAGAIGAVCAGGVMARGEGSSGVIGLGGAPGVAGTGCALGKRVAGVVVGSAGWTAFALAGGVTGAGVVIQVTCIAGRCVSSRRSGNSGSHSRSATPASPWATSTATAIQPIRRRMRTRSMSPTRGAKLANVDAAREGAMAGANEERGGKVRRRDASGGRQGIAFWHSPVPRRSAGCVR